MRRWLLALAVVVLASGCGGGGKTTKSPSRNLEGTPSRPQTFYNYCSAELYNSTPDSFTLSSSDKYGHDDWIDTPSSIAATPYYLGWNPATQGRETWITPGFGAVTRWTSQSGFARGCWNTATFSNRFGSFTFYLEDPYRGSNTYTCKTTGPYTCKGPGIDDFNWDRIYGSRYRPWPWSPSLSGDRLTAIWEIRRTDDYIPAGFSGPYPFGLSKPSLEFCSVYRTQCDQAKRTKKR